MSNRPSRVEATWSHWACMSSPDTWAKTVLKAADTMGWWPLGMVASRFRAKWTRQRWWDAPWKHRLMADTSPVCWSEMTSCTPSRPRARSLPQELPPEDLVLRVPDVDTQDLPMSGGGHPGGDDHGLGGHLVVLPDVEVGGVQVHVGEGHVVQPPLPEASRPPRPARHRSGTPRTGRCPS